MKEARPEGKLDVRVVAGRNLPRRGFFGRGDSRVDLTLGMSKKQTQVDKKGGSSPEWNDRIHFAVGGLGKTQMHVSAVEMDSSISHKTIGACVIDLTEVFEDEEVDGWYSLTRHDKPAGDIYLEFTFTPKGGRTKPSKQDMTDEEEEENVPQLAPTKVTSSSTVASAPVMMHQDQSGSVTSFSAPSISSASTVPVLSAPMRPSLSDLRPYSSASMHNPELANKYAQKHGKKPLPAAPAQSLPATTMDNQSTYQTAQPPPPMMMSYDQTVMPGQVSMLQQQQQQQPIVAPSPIPYPQQVMLQQQQQQQQPLMNLFAPPAAPPMDSGQQAQQNKFLPIPPQQTTPTTAASPAYNPAYNPDFAVDSVDTSMSQQRPQSKLLPTPPLLVAGGVQPIDMPPMASSAVPMHTPQYHSLPPTMGGQMFSPDGIGFGSVPDQMYQMQSPPYTMSQGMMSAAVQYQQPQIIDQYNPGMAVAQQSMVADPQQMQHSQVYMSPAPASQPQQQQLQQMPVQMHMQSLPQMPMPNQPVVYSPMYVQGQQMASGAQIVYIDPQQPQYQDHQFHQDQQFYQGQYPQEQYQQLQYQQPHLQPQQIYHQQAYQQPETSVEPSAPTLPPMDNGTQPQLMPSHQMYAPNNTYGNQTAY